PIRMISGSIKNGMNFLNLDELDKKFSDINKMIDYAVLHIEMTRMLSLPEEELPNSTCNTSLLNCIKYAIATYPFQSQKLSASINILSGNVDFLINLNEKLVIHIFYCLIRNAIFSINAGEVAISLESEAHKRVAVRFMAPFVLQEKKSF